MEASFQNMDAGSIAFALNTQFGFNVFPLLPKSKKPASSWKRWQTEHVDEDQINDWIAQYPNCNWAIPCGPVSDLIIVDVDDHKALPWVREHLPRTPWVVKTTNGWHLYYRWPKDDFWLNQVRQTGHTDFKDRWNVDIDFQKDGFYCVAPGSVHPSGTVYTPYFDGPWENVPEYRCYNLPGLPADTTEANEHLSGLDLSCVPANYSVTAKGNRNNMLTVFAGKLVAQRHPFEAVLRQTLEHNRSFCTPPLPENEVRMVVKSCFKMHGENHPQQVPAADTSMAQDMEGLRLLPQEQLVERPIPEVLLHPGGLLEDIQQYILGTHVCTHPVFATAGAIILLSTLLGYKVQTETQLVTNTYIVLLGLSGSGKDAPKKAIAHILEQVAPDYLAGMDVASNVAIFTHLSTPGKQRALYMFDEIGLLLKECRNSNSPKAGIIAALTKLFSSPTTPYSISYADNKKNKTVAWHCMNMLGLSVPSEFYESLNQNAALNGFLARILVFDVPNYTGKRREKTTIEVPPDLVATLKELAGYKTSEENQPVTYPDGSTRLFGKPNPITLDLDEAASEFHWAKYNYYDQLRVKYSAEGKNAQASIISRMAEIALKLSPVFTCSRVGGAVIFKVRFITYQDVKNAWDIVEWSALNTIVNVETSISSTVFEAACQKIRKIIVQYVRRSISKSKCSSNNPLPGAPFSAIAKGTKDIPDDMVRKAIDKLIQANELRICQNWKSSPKSKRAMDLYCLVEETSEENSNA